MTRELKIKIISNGYVVTDPNNCERYYSSTEEISEIFEYDLKNKMGLIGEFTVEYSINSEGKFKKKDRLIAEYRNALLVITNTECIMECDTVKTMKEIAEDYLNINEEKDKK